MSDVTNEDRRRQQCFHLQGVPIHWTESDLLTALTSVGVSGIKMLQIITKSVTLNSGVVLIISNGDALILFNGSNGREFLDDLLMSYNSRTSSEGKIEVRKIDLLDQGHKLQTTLLQLVSAEDPGTALQVPMDVFLQFHCRTLRIREKILKINFHQYALELCNVEGQSTIDLISGISQRPIQLQLMLGNSEDDVKRNVLGSEFVVVGYEGKIPCFKFTEIIATEKSSYTELASNDAPLSAEEQQVETVTSASGTDDVKFKALKGDLILVGFEGKIPTYRLIKNASDTSILPEKQTDDITPSSFIKTRQPEAATSESSSVHSIMATCELNSPESSSCSSCESSEDDGIFMPEPQQSRSVLIRKKDQEQPSTLPNSTISQSGTACQSEHNEVTNPIYVRGLYDYWSGCDLARYFEFELGCTVNFSAVYSKIVGGKGSEYSHHTLQIPQGHGVILFATTAAEMECLKRGTFFPEDIPRLSRGRKNILKVKKAVGAALIANVMKAAKLQAVVTSGLTPLQESKFAERYEKMASQSHRLLFDNQVRLKSLQKEQGLSFVDLIWDILEFHSDWWKEQYEAKEKNAKKLTRAKRHN